MFLSGRSLSWHSLRKLGLAIPLAAAVTVGSPALAKDSTPGSGTVAVAQLPAEAQATHRLIQTGGPFPYAKDGVKFGNREHLLPTHPRGYYREYTVRTPGAHDRGAKRIVCGGRKPARPDVCFYTDDHYASFRRILR